MARIILGVPCGIGPAWTPKTSMAIHHASTRHTVKVVQPVKEAWDRVEILWRRLLATMKPAPGLRDELEMELEKLRDQTSTANASEHSVQMVSSIGSWDNHNLLWASALNAGQKKKADLYVNVHSDIELSPGWLDTMVDIQRETGAEFLSCVVPQKALSGATSSGIGDAEDPWAPHRRFTMQEVWAKDSPDHWNADDCGYPDSYLLHNTGCWMADLNCPKWYKTEQRADGRSYSFACFDFQWCRSIQYMEEHEDKFQVRGESEDWYFSRMLHRLKIRSFITRKVALNHIGPMEFGNQNQWGSEKHEPSKRYRLPNTPVEWEQ